LLSIVSGQDGSVNTIIIKGGDIEAYGGEDAAGIGTGEEFEADGIISGTIEIHGGKIYAYGKGYGAGIGAYHDEHDDGCHIGWAGWQRIYIGECMRLWTWTDHNGYWENVHYTENWWNFVHQRPRVAIGECNHVDGAYDITNCPYCHSYTLQLQ